MRRIRTGFVRLRGLFQKERQDRELAEEIESHLQMHIEDNLRAGMTHEEARRNAMIKLGGIEATKERCRDRLSFPVLESLAQDLRYGLRMMGKNRGFTAVAVLTLALGIGANTAIFSLLEAVVLRQLPVSHPERLVLLQWTGQEPASWHSHSSYGGCEPQSLGARRGGCSFSYPVFDLFRSKARSFDGIFAFAGPVGVQARIRDEITPARALLVSGEFFATLGVPAQWGRMLDAKKDDQPGAQPVAVLSYACWQERFGGDPAIVGKMIRLNGLQFTIAGVARKEFFGLQPMGLDLWIPVHSGRWLGQGWWSSLDAQTAWLYVIGRLKPGVRPEQARAELEVLFRQAVAADAQPGSKLDGQPGIALISAARGLAGLRMAYSPLLQVLLAVTGFVLLIACVNIANLLLARTAARHKEMAARVAIGAGRGRLIRQLLTESLLLALMGGAAGLVLAWWASLALVAFISSGTTVRLLLDVRPNPVVFGFAVAMAGLAAILFGIVPALAGTGVEPAAALRASAGIAGGGTRAAGRRSHLGRLLVAGEMALALVLIIGAGLFLRTLVNLEKLDPGFRRDHLLIVEVSKKREGKSVEDQPTVNAEIRERLAALPGVLSTTWSSDLLLAGNIATSDVHISGRKNAERQEAATLSIGPRFFETMKIPILAGRDVQPEDCRDRPNVVWINQALARKYFRNEEALGQHVEGSTRSSGSSRGIQSPNESPLGQHIEGPSREIVGIVGDAKYERLRAAILPTVYTPNRTGRVFTLRTAADPMLLAGTVRRTINEATSSLLIDRMKSQSELVDLQLFQERMMTRLTTIFGLLALALAAIGIYGVVAYSVTRRTPEIAIRMSLGAMPSDIVRLVLAEGVLPAVIGVAVGLLASYGLTRLIAVALFGVQPLDALTYAGATLVLLAIASLACYIPARRAMRVQPMTALRCE